MIRLALFACALVALLCISGARAQTCPATFDVKLANSTQFSVSASGDATATGSIVAGNALRGKTLQLTSQSTAPTCDVSTLGSVAVINQKTSVCQASGSGTYAYSGLVTEASAWTTIDLGTGVGACTNSAGMAYALPAYQIISNRVFLRGCFTGPATLLNPDTQITATVGNLPPPPAYSWRQTILVEGLTALLGAATGISYVTMNPGAGTLTLTSVSSLLNIVPIVTLSRLHLDGINYAIGG